MPPCAQLAAAPHWRTVDFLSDLHLQASEPATVAAWQRYLAQTPADAVFLLGDVFEGFARALLQQWLVDSRTGDKRLRAGMPADWKIGGKTGSGENGTACDTLIIWPTPQSGPVLVTAYLTGSKSDAAGRDAALAKAGEAIKRWYYAI